MRNFKSELKVWFTAAAVATVLMLSFKGTHAAPNSIELCNWGKWSYAQNISLKDLVETLNSVEGMPVDDKMIIVECYVASMETM